MIKHSVESFKPGSFGVTLNVLIVQLSKLIWRICNSALSRLCDFFCFTQKCRLSVRQFFISPFLMHTSPLHKNCLSTFCNFYSSFTLKAIVLINNNNRTNCYFDIVQKYALILINLFILLILYSEATLQK